MKDNPVFLQILQFEMQDTLKVVRYIARISNIDFPAYTTYEDGTECSETSAYKIQTLGNNPKERIQHSKQGERLI